MSPTTVMSPFLSCTGYYTGSELGCLMQLHLPAVGLSFSVCSGEDIL